MALTYDALLAKYPWLEGYPQNKVEFWINIAPSAIGPPRFSERAVEHARELYVVHTVVDTHAELKVIGKEVVKLIPGHSAPRAPANARERARVRAMVGWGRTIHGQQLFAMQQVR